MGRESEAINVLGLQGRQAGPGEAGAIDAAVNGLGDTVHHVAIDVLNEIEHLLVLAQRRQTARQRVEQRVMIPNAPARGFEKQSLDDGRALGFTRTLERPVWHPRFVYEGDACAGPRALALRRRVQ